MINKNSYYSQIAQAMFRLRKLNIGHSIDFICMDDYHEKDDIICYLRQNEEDIKNNKNKYLLYQTLKSEIRNKKKLNKIGKIFDNINEILIKKEENFKIEYNDYHLEKIKYYYHEYHEYNKDSFIILEGIIDREDIINSEHNNQLFKKINKSIGILVYNINSIEQEQEQEREQERGQHIGYSINEHKVKNDSVVFKYEYIRYDFDDLKCDFNIFKHSTIEISDKIRCLPNLFSQLNTYSFINNISGFLFVYIHNILLLIPGYLLVEFDEFPLLTLTLKVINNKLIDSDILSQLKNNDIYKIFTFDDSFEYTPESGLAHIMLRYFNNIVKFQSDFLNNKEILTSINYIISKFETFYKNNNQLFVKPKYEESYNKYLKYKLKYIKLKNNMNNI